MDSNQTPKLEVADKTSPEQLEMLGKLSKLEHKLFKRATNTNLIKRLTLLHRINHYRKLLNMNVMELKDFTR